MGATAGVAISAITTGLGFEQQQAAASAASQRGRLQNDMAERNATIAEMQREDALNRGATAEDRARGETDQRISSTRAALAAQGIDAGAGSAAQVTTSERLVGQVDALTIRDNAAREAWGFDVQAANDREQGKLALIAGENEAATDRLASYGTLLSGATSIYKASTLRAPQTKQAPTPPQPAAVRSGEPGPSNILVG